MQLNLLPLTEFEIATLDTMVSMKAKSIEHHALLMSSAKMIEQAQSLVLKWNTKRSKLNFEIWE